MPEEQKQTENGGGGQVAGGWWGLGQKYFGMSPGQQLGALLAGVLVFGGYVFLVQMQTARQIDNERWAMFMRTIESDGERSRQAADARAKASDAAVAENTRLAMAANQRLSVELGKVVQELANANATNQKLTQQVAELSRAFAEWSKKMPPLESINDRAPMPRMKSGSLTVG